MKIFGLISVLAFLFVASCDDVSDARKKQCAYAAGQLNDKKSADRYYKACLKYYSR